MIRAARRVLTRMPGRTVLLLDDCQWSNGALFELIDDCLERKSSMLIVAASRDDLPENHHLHSYQQAPLIRVGGLSKVATRRLLESMAGALPDAAIEWVWSASLGDPFMAEATLRGLVECRALKSAEGSWKVAAENESVARISRRGALILVERLTTLSSATRKVMQAGAVVGRRFQPVIVAAVTEMALEQVASAVEEARQRHLVWRTEDGLSYQFAHDRILETVLEQIPPTRLAPLHRTVAQQFLVQDEDRVYEVAYHYGRAGDWRQAFPYALRAADMARKTLAPEVAQEYYKIAEKGIEQADSRTRLRLFMGLGEVLALRGRYTEAESYYFQAREHRDDSMAGADIESRLATIYGFTDPGACREAADRALSFLGRSLHANRTASTLKELVVAASRIFKSPPPQVDGSQREADLLGKVCHALCTAATTEGDKAAAIWPLFYGMNCLERLPPTGYLAAISGNLAVGLALVGLPTLAAPVSAKAQRKAEAVGQVLALGQVFARRQVLRLAQGRFREVVAEFDQMMGLIEPSGDAWEIASAKTHAGLAFCYRGHLKVAFEMGLEGLREARREADLLNVGSSIRLCALTGLGYRHFEEIPERAEPLVKAFLAFADGLHQLYSGKPEKATLPLKKATGLAHMGFHTAPFSAWLVTAYRQTAEALPPEGARLPGSFCALLETA